MAPLLMAVLTLRKVWASRDVFGVPPVKIGRRAVRAALLATHVISARPATFGFLLGVLRRPLPGSAPPHSAL